MSSQVFKKSVPSLKLFNLLEKICDNHDKHFILSKTAFQKAATSSIDQIAKPCAQGPAIAIGGPFCDDDKLYNSYYILADGKIQAVIKKHHLPNEEVFDEVRLFSSGNVDGPFQIL